MEHSLRRYEAVQRLLWFLFFLLCLGISYPVSKMYQLSYFNSSGPARAFQPELLKSTAFWTQLHWMQVQPIGSAMVYVLWVAILFLAGRAIWLVLQFIGKQLVSNLLASHIRQIPAAPVSASHAKKPGPDPRFPYEALYKKVSRLPLRLVFHSFQRLRLILANPQGTLSSEELTEKERRIVETDWQVLWSSWTPFRWLLWLLPLMGLMLSSWLFYSHLKPALSGQKDLQDLIGPVSVSLLPLVQVIVIAVVLNLVAGLIKRLENLYLSNVDALFYDQFLSRLPFQSSDTVIILEALERHFKDIRSLLRDLKYPPGSGGRSSGDLEL